MPLEDPTTIDICTVTDDKKPLLIITDSGATTDPKQRYELFVQKLQCYVFAIIEGALADEYPDARASDYRIRLVCAHLPTEQMLAISGIKPRGHADLFIPVEFEQWGGETGAEPRPIERTVAPPPQINEELSRFADLCIRAGLNAIRDKDCAAHVAWMENDEFKTAVLGQFVEPLQIQLAAAQFVRDLPVAPALFATWADGTIGTKDGTKTDAVLVHAYQTEPEQGIVFGQAYRPKTMLRKFEADGNRLILGTINQVF